MASILYSATLFVAFILCHVNGQYPCTTPSGGKGTCKSIYQCQQLLDLIMKNRTAENDDLVKRSQCGYVGTTPAVCCPDPCLTAEGNPGQCMHIYSCPHLKAMLVPPVPKRNIDYLRNSTCQGPERFSVCCGPQEYNARISPSAVNSCEKTLTSYPPDPLSNCCGKESSFGNKIVGGTETSIDQYPWLALLEYNVRGAIVTLCGGALISAKYVLTAAHCVTGAILSFGTPVNVRLGEHNTSHANPDCVPVEAGGEDCNEDLVVIPIAQTIPHQDYSNARKMGDDIALVRMQRMAPYTDFIRPICLPTVDLTLAPPAVFTLFAAGWGATSTSQPESPIKMHVDLPLVTTGGCSSLYSAGARLGSKQICAGGVAGKDSCKGDSGGPLMFENNRTYEAIGVVSFGPMPCGQENMPGVYTKVYDYKNWIISNIRP